MQAALAFEPCQRLECAERAAAMILGRVSLLARVGGLLGATGVLFGTHNEANSCNHWVPTLGIRVFEWNRKRALGTSTERNARANRVVAKWHTQTGAESTLRAESTNRLHINNSSKIEL
jgi:hypothetical protein